MKEQMSSPTPFIDRSNRTIKTDQILSEAIPLAKLIGLVGGVALIPFLIAVTIDVFPMVFTIVGQFVLAVGSGIILMYVITRSLQLAD